MSVTIIQDHVAQRGGAERVLASMARAFEGSPIRTSVLNSAATYPEVSELPIDPMWFSGFGPFQRNHRLAFPLMAPAFSMLRIDSDVALCASAGWSHGARSRGIKVVYWYAPARWLYQKAEYVGRRGWGAKVVSLMAPWLERWDHKAATGADHHIAISSAIAMKLHQIYGVTAEVLHPPITLQAVPTPVSGLDPGFLLVVSRLMSYKNVDVVLEAVRNLPEHRLIVVGTGPYQTALMAMAPSNTQFIGSVTDGELVWLYSNALAVLSAAYEDFGLTPLEAAQYGTPALVLRAGGFLDTIEEGLTGAFFDTLSTAEVVRGIDKVVNRTWDASVLRAHAARFSEQRFVESLRRIVAEAAGDQ